MLKSDLVQTDKHSIKILLRRKNINIKPLLVHADLQKPSRMFYSGCIC